MATDVQTLISFPYPLENEIHIHCVTLSSKVPFYISPDEELRAQCLLNPEKKRHFVASHGLLRAILGGYLGKQPQELQFSVGEHGKPSLSGDDARLNFNMSHSGHLFLLAIAADREVGIDVEHIRADLPFAKMAHLAFNSREQSELFSLPDHLQLSSFYCCWTRKEAYLKASGTGFTVPSNGFDVSLLPETPASVIKADTPSHWHLHDITVPTDYCAALAVKGSEPIIRFIE